MQIEDSDAEEDEGMDRDEIAKQLFDGDDVSLIEIILICSNFFSTLMIMMFVFFFITCAINLVLVCPLTSMFWHKLNIF